jgi:hypothetical protein
MKSILIYKDTYDTDKYNNIIKYNNKIYELYDGKIINPPFFDNIYIEHDKLTNDDLKMIYNMLNVNGTLYFIKKYNIFFKQNKKLVKKDNFQYSINYNRVVDFIIAGTQKGGTTALALNISQHKDIYIDKEKDPRKSEIHFFDIYWKKGINYYKSKFDYSKKMVGEKTPEIMYLPHTFPLIQSINPYIKIIIILRNPIERAYSSWKMVKKNYNETKSFEDAINYELKYKLKENKTFYTATTHYLQRGLYYKQIKKMLKWFPKHNILVLISEKVKDNMEEEYNKVYEFLNIEKFKTNYTLEFESNDQSKIDPIIYKKLVTFFKKDVMKLEKLLNIKTDWFS